MAVFLSLLLPIEHRRTRLVLFALAPLLDVRSLTQLVAGPSHVLLAHPEWMTVFTEVTALIPGVSG
jgi:hypothetical protein